MGGKAFNERYGTLLQSARRAGRERASARSRQEDCIALPQNRHDSHLWLTESDVVDADSGLRDYQQRAVREILAGWRTCKSLMLRMPSGTGKTRLFVALVNALRETDAANYRIGNRPQALASPADTPKLLSPRFLLVAHREELVEQISDTLFLHYGLPHVISGKGRRGPFNGPDTDNSTSFSGPDTEEHAPLITVSSIQYLSRRLKVQAETVRPDAYDFIVIDEAHHSLSKSYTLLYSTYAHAYKLGVTATPCRLRRHSFVPQFQKLIHGGDLPAFIAQGYLSDYRFFTVGRNRSALQQVNRLTKTAPCGDYPSTDLQEICAHAEEVSFLYDCYKRHADGLHGIIYAVNRFHSTLIAEYFGERGVSIASIDSRTSGAKRKELVSRFRRGELQVLVNVELFVEGFDCPAVEFVLLARPTRSLSLYLQQTGRALRPFPSIDCVMILDCVGLYNRFGLPERKRDWDAHFHGRKAEGEDYASPLGLDAETDGMTEIKTPRAKTAETTLPKVHSGEAEVFGENGLYGIRDGSNTVKLSPCCTELVRTPDGWFHGKDKDGCLVVADSNGHPVFRRRHCELEHQDDGCFFLLFRTPDRRVTRIGPYDRRLCIASRHLTPFEFGYRQYPYVPMISVYYLSNGAAVSTYRLSPETVFYRRIVDYGRSPVLVDFDNRAWQLSSTGRLVREDFPLEELHRILRRPSLWAKPV